MATERESSFVQSGGRIVPPLFARGGDERGKLHKGPNNKPEIERKSHCFADDENEVAATRDEEIGIGADGESGSEIEEEEERDNEPDVEPLIALHDPIKLAAVRP